MNLFKGFFSDSPLLFYFEPGPTYLTDSLTYHNFPAVDLVDKSRKSGFLLSPAAMAPLVSSGRSDGEDIEV